MAQKHEAVAAGTAHGSDTHSAGTVYCPPEDRANQRAAILAHLKQHRSISTLEARRWLSIMSPASRIFELRRRGHNILTERDPVQRCARYHLPAESGGGSNAGD